MPKKQTHKPEKGTVILVAYDATGTVVVEERLRVFDYYEESHPLIDSVEHRKERGIRRLSGRVFDHAGNLSQEFDCHYSATGQLVESLAKHADGTVTRFPEPSE